MINLPTSTQINRPLPKTKLFAMPDFKTANRKSFDADVSQLTIVRQIATLETLCRNEKQFNKQIEIAAEIKKLKDQLYEQT